MKYAPHNVSIDSFANLMDPGDDHEVLSRTANGCNDVRAASFLLPVSPPQDQGFNRPMHVRANSSEMKSDTLASLQSCRHPASVA